MTTLVVEQMPMERRARQDMDGTVGWSQPRGETQLKTPVAYSTNENYGLAFGVFA